MQAAPCDLYKKIYIYMLVFKAAGGAAVVFAPGGLQNVENHFP